ncbi:hypothetical protein B0H11DRAFT_1970392 [Mycena galericulata]|nr:hypothetical protein B0H11DRAFT_1970392 [Mycena galericulata]
MPETVEEPPSYDGYGFESLVISSNADDSDLPVYQRRPTPPPRPAQAELEPRKFTYELKNRGKTPWATLFIHGDPRFNNRIIPTVLEGSNLDGSVTLNLQSPETIQAVCILIKGEIVSGSAPMTRTAFLESRHELWSAAEGDPRASENTVTGKNSTVKLKGDYHWPLSIQLPTTLCKDGKNFTLPHTFLDRLASFSVQYTAELRLVRAKLRPDDKVACTFGYFSMRQPGPPSMLRQLGIPGEYPFSSKGTIFSSRMIDVKCMLCYTRSASIPCAMTFESEDLQALDLLSSPATCFVYLERVTQESSEGWRNTREPCGQASLLAINMRLMGEIHLKTNLQPSSAVFGFAVEYSVVVFPFQTTGFKPLDSKPLLSQGVEITTRYAPGPRHKTYSPPTYETRNANIDYYYYSMVMEGRAVRGRRG